MSKKIIVLLIVAVVIIIAFFWLHPLPYVVDDAESIKGSEITRLETGVTYAPQNYSLLYKALWYQTHPFLEQYFPINPSKNIRQEPITSMFNSAKNLFVARQTEYGGGSPARALLVFSPNGSYIKSINIPQNIATQISQVQWVNNKILTSGWNSSVQFQQYLINPEQENPQFVPLPLETKWNYVPYTTTVTDNIVVGKRCSRGSSDLSGNFDCKQTTVQTMNTETGSIEDIFVKSIPDNQVCVGAKDEQIFVKEITESALETTFGQSQKETSDPTFGIYDSCNNTKHLNSDKTRLTIIPVESIGKDN